MSGNYNSYESPFCTRYASEEMQYIFSADKKFTTWRKLWVALARAEMKLGLPVTKAQVKQLEEHINDIDYDMAEARERKSVTTLWLMFIHTARLVPMRQALSTSEQLRAM